MTRKAPLVVLALAALTAAAVATPALGGRQDVAIVKINGIVLRANGGVVPRALPARRYAPIALRGYANIRGAGRRPPPRLEHLTINFTRNSRVQTRGLAVCPPPWLEGKGTRAARRLCRRALVATGNVEARVDPPDVPPFPVRAPVTVFNAPPENGRPMLAFHSHVSLPVQSASIPATQTYVVVEPLLPSRRGGFKVDVDVPEIANGYGSFTHGDLKIGKRVYRFRGRRHSFISARCPTGVLYLWGRLRFADETVISGTLFAPCRPLPQRRRSRH
jgi:hypothetical protein